MEALKKDEQKPKETERPNGESNLEVLGKANRDAPTTPINSQTRSEIRTFTSSVKTTMDVEMISPNHLHFVAEPEPPDPGNSVGEKCLDIEGLDGPEMEHHAAISEDVPQAMNA
ncbi:hypothetical protein SESBI_40165 [Sesbania bispinosa]|nr:hypothetical protein SESBI_40165 [Sesbania bispinosa]